MNEKAPISDETLLNDIENTRKELAGLEHLRDGYHLLSQLPENSEAVNSKHAYHSNMYGNSADECAKFLRRLLDLKRKRGLKTPKPLADLRIRCAEMMGFDLEGITANGWDWKDIDDTKYDTDRNALMELVEAVPEEKHSEFIVKLWNQLYPLKPEHIFGNPQLPHKMVWDAMTASPEVIMRAFLEVMED